MIFNASFVFTFIFTKTACEFYISISKLIIVQNIGGETFYLNLVFQCCVTTLYGSEWTVSYLGDYLRGMFLFVKKAPQTLKHLM